MFFQKSSSQIKNVLKITLEINTLKMPLASEPEHKRLDWQNS